MNGDQARMNGDQALFRGCVFSFIGSLSRAPSCPF
jgi:hypothetical protein